MPAPPTLAQRKAALRVESLARRAEAAARQGEGASRAVAALVEQAIGAGPRVTIAGYWPLAGELDPRPTMERLSARGHQLALPRMQGRGSALRFHAWRPGDALRMGRFKVMEPAADAAPAMPDVVLVPLLAFDARGRRLGYGAGFYDRTLAALRASKPGVVALGLAFAVQEVDAVPADEHDQLLDAVVTEGGWRDFARAMAVRDAAGA